MSGIILSKLKISSLDYAVFEDLKVLLQMVKKQSAISKLRFPFRMTSLLTLKNLRKKPKEAKPSLIINN